MKEISKSINKPILADLASNSSQNIDTFLKFQAKRKIQKSIDIGDYDTYTNIDGFTIIGGLPGAGKTALLCNLATKAASPTGGRIVYFYSFEMNKTNILIRLLQILNTKRFQDIIQMDESKTIDCFQHEVLNNIYIKDLTDYIEEKDDKAELQNIDFQAIKKEIQANDTNNGREPLLLIDSLHTMPYAKEKATDKQLIDEKMLNLRSIADSGIDVILIGQSNRENSKKDHDITEPNDINKLMSFFSGSAAIEFTVDKLVVIMPDLNEKNALYVVKNRYGRNLLKYTYSYDKETQQTESIMADKNFCENLPETNQIKTNQEYEPKTEDLPF